MAKPKFFIKINKFIKILTDIILPRRCFYCNSIISNNYLCSSCLSKINYLNPPFCRGCGKHYSHQKYNICPQCRHRQIYQERTICAVKFSPPITELIYLFKYYHYHFFDHFFAKLIIKQLSRLKISNNIKADFIIPVPIHKSKLKQRGYNQSELLAKKLSLYLKIPLKNGIIFSQRHRSQTLLNHKKRWQNVAGKFKLGEKAEIKGKNLLLIDDVVTSGATCTECSRILKEKGANSIIVIGLANG